jgi:sialate O-acetylesterase
MRRLLGITLTALWVLSVAAVTRAEVKLPGIFGDHAVLQRELPVPVWGWADPGEKVTVTLADQQKTATADAGGKWSLKLDPLKAGGPYELKVQGKNRLTRSDLLVGEVWLCSGQSNMGMTVGGVLDKDREIAEADYPKIRMATPAHTPLPEPTSDTTVSWAVCSPKTVANFSATAYFFGRQLHRDLDVPVGLINSSWGGTPIEAWTSLPAQKAAPELAPIAEKYLKTVASYDPDKAQQQYQKQLADWEKARAKAKAEQKPFKTQKPREPMSPEKSPNSAATLYNGMIVPLVPYAIRGAIWYQGESNAGNAAIYGTQMRTMIANWRKDWNQGDFPFLFVQLPNFLAVQTKPSETGGWPLIREQFVRTLAVPNAGMAVTIDVGEADNIHPRNKQAVGKRLAQWALAKVYGKDLVACGPLYKSMRKDGGRVVLDFDYAEGGLEAKGGGPLTGFAIAGPDKKFVWADAKIEGRTVVVSSKDVRDPAAVRYAWANNPACNLFNTAGLPASPFRTDDWKE